jgi:hypothetical protein
MRIALLALAVSSLTLAGCGKKQEAANTAALDQSVSAEDFATNDVTAIDAATGADANMAADVDINLVDNAGDDEDRPGNSSRSRERSGSGATNTANTAQEPAEEREAAPAEPAESNSD